VVLQMTDSIERLSYVSVGLINSYNSFFKKTFFDMIAGERNARQSCRTHRCE
jgi:hypothetical protein